MDSELLVVIVVVIAAYISLEMRKVKQHASILIEYLRYRKVITRSNKALFFSHCGMEKHVFQVLLRILTSPIGGLTDGAKIGTGEKIMIFLNIMRGNTHRDGLSLWCLTPFRGVRYHLKE